MTIRKPDALEISSGQIHADLSEIKERIAALETISSLANRSTVEAYARECLGSKALRDIMAACEEPKTKEALRLELGYASVPALDHHLKQIRQYDLLQQETDDAGKLIFRWSNLFARLPPRTLLSLLGKTLPRRTNKKTATGVATSA